MTMRSRPESAAAWASPYTAIASYAAATTLASGFLSRAWLTVVAKLPLARSAYGNSMIWLEHPSQLPSTSFIPSAARLPPKP
jgi:hypothetical protein